jgi:hypothetical protein
MVSSIQCPHCGELTDTFVDASVDERQEYVEDCVVCCRPIRFIVSWSDADGAHRVEAAEA